MSPSDYTGTAIKGQAQLDTGLHDCGLCAFCSKNAIGQLTFSPTSKDRHSVVSFVTKSTETTGSV